MSWQTYVDEQICSVVKSKTAVIASRADGSIWAVKQIESEKPVTEEELKAISDTLKTDPSSFQEHGIRFAGEKYFCILAMVDKVYGRRGGSALCIVPTKTCILAVSTIDGFLPGSLNIVVEKLGDYLKSNDF